MEQSSAINAPFTSRFLVMATLYSSRPRRREHVLGQIEGMAGRCLRANEKESMCNLCEIIGDILPRGKMVTEVLLDRMLVGTHENPITRPVLP